MAALGRCRLLVAALVVAFTAAPRAAEKSPAAIGLSCEQLVAVVESAVQMRDHGHSLQQVLAELKIVEAEGKLSAEQLQVLRKSVTAAYLGNASIEEIALACKEAREKRR